MGVSRSLRQLLASCLTIHTDEWSLLLCICKNCDLFCYEEDLPCLALYYYDSIQVRLKVFKVLVVAAARDMASCTRNLKTNYSTKFPIHCNEWGWISLNPAPIKFSNHLDGKIHSGSFSAWVHGLTNSLQLFLRGGAFAGVSMFSDHRPTQKKTEMTRVSASTGSRHNNSQFYFYRVWPSVSTVRQLILRITEKRPN